MVCLAETDSIRRHLSPPGKVWGLTFGNVSQEGAKGTLTVREEGI